ncbi:MAG TPA: hypothetical protein V6C65_15515, partial [Allocoleopsis sp.]
MPKLGDLLDLKLELGDGKTDAFVQAHVLDLMGADIPGSPVMLNHVGYGLYLNSTLMMPMSREVIA